MKLATTIAAVALGACGFDLQLGGTRVDGGGSDGANGSDGAMTLDGMEIDTPASLVPCSTPSVTGLLACYELEDGVTDGVLRDSSAAQRDAMTTGLAAAQRDKPSTSQAATNPGIAQTYVPDSPDLDLPSGYTVTVWINPSAVPSPSGVFGIYDHERQYAAVVGRTPTGGKAQLRCINTGSSYVPTPNMPTSTWSFAACTFDGTNLCASYWSSSLEHERVCAIPDNGIATLGQEGLAIGHLSNNGSPESPFVGAFDSLQLYNRALTEAELCAIAGQPPTCLD